MRLALLVLLLAASGVALAHPGGLNREGCHNDRKNGGYHCHGGRSAAPAVPSGAHGFDGGSRASGSGGSAFRNCAAARAAGAAPVRRGDAGYGSHLDADGDGVGCEPYRRR